MAVFEFVSLTCITPSEFDGDEVYILFNGVKVFPGPEQRFRSYKAGTKIVNTEARLSGMDLEALRSGSDTTALTDMVGADSLRRVDIPEVGLLLKVMDFDSITSDDELGSILVSDRSESGLQERRLTGDRSEYVLTFLVQPGIS